MTSEALNADLEAARAGAIAAFELECRGDLRAAAAGFAQVRSQLLYLADVCIPNALPELGEACRAVLQAVDARCWVAISPTGPLSHTVDARLTQQAAGAADADDGPPDATEDMHGSQHPATHWVHLDGAAAAAAGAFYGSAGSTCDVDELLPHPTAAATVRLVAGMAAAGGTLVPTVASGVQHELEQDWCGGGDGSGGGGGGGGGAATNQSAAKLELLRACQRDVGGTLDDVVGHECVKEELEEAVFMPLRYPGLFKGIRRPPRNFLLYGPPGTGKTLLIEKLASEAGLTLLSLSPSAVLSKWSGDAERALRLAFDVARDMAPAALFLDEIDALGRARGGGGGGDDTGGRRLLTELLLQLGDLGCGEGVYVFGATNRMEDCDPALLRRFERRIHVPLPDASARAAFLSSMLARPEIASPLAPGEVERLAALTEGFSGSDMACLCRQAAMAPVRELFAATAGRRRRQRRSVDPAASSGGGGGGAGSGAGGGRRGGDAQQAVRKLVFADFEAALRTVRPASLDAHDGGRGATASPAAGRAIKQE